jgi:uncharacterized protein (TIGR02284 family)
MATETQYEALVDGLNNLIELNYDRERGYLKASEDVEDADLKPLFRSLSEDSAKYASELAEYVRHVKGEPVTGQTLSGKVHQVWLDIKAAITGRDRDAVIGSAQFGDKAAVEAYDKLLGEEKVSMLPELMSTLHRQRDAIQRGLGVISAAKHDDDDRNATGTGYSSSNETDFAGPARTSGGHVDPISGNY